ncbi:MAG: MFS transporter, partial [Planctomycetes bacterium]|nr:MFS transporter [Planctomycetota bacterium]
QIAGVAGWRLLFIVGILPALLVVLVMRRLREPDSWLKARDAARDAAARDAARDAAARGPSAPAARQAMGSIGELFGDPRWRRNAIVGIVLATAGVMGLWGVGFWSPELVRNQVLGGQPKDVQDWYASMAFLIQQMGAFLGIFAFSILTGIIGRRPTFVLSLLLGLATVIGVFGFMTQPSQIWWMCPLLGFSTLMVFGGYSIYFPELFPTRLRATGVGFCYNVARYVAAAAPFALGLLATAYAAPPGSGRAAQGLSELTLLGSLGSVDNPFRYACITVACIYVIGLFVLPFAPETKDKPLPE